MIDRAKFFAGVRSRLGHLTQGQVAGMSVILDEWEARELGDLRWLANINAEAWHETATRMEPVIETRRANEATNPSVDEAIARLESSWRRRTLTWVKEPYWRKDARGLSWLGRGYPQVTHRDNYAKAEAATGITFTDNPDLMLQAGPAVKTLFWGMIEGGFTGRKLSQYFSASRDDPAGARHIIGADAADKVARYHQAFLAALAPAGDKVA